MKKILAVLTLAMVMSTSGCGDISTIESASGTSSTPAIVNPVTEQVLWDSENVKISFMEIIEYDYMKGYCYLRLKVENKTDKEITVYPKDAYANDTSIVVGSGTPMTLLPGKKSQTPFFFAYTNFGIASIDEIEKIEITMWVVDDDFNTIEETDNLVINIP